MGQGSMRAVVILVLYLLILSVPLSAQGWEQKLHVIVVQDQSALYKEPRGDFEVIRLASSELPEVFSQLLVPSAGERSTGGLRRLGFPPQSEFVDMFTFDITDEVVEKNKRMKRNNRIAHFSYDLKVRNWDSEYYGIELNGKAIKKVSALVPKNATTLIRFKSPKRYLFAFTPLRSASLTTSELIMDESVQNPVPIKQTIPEYPEEFLFWGGQATCVVLCIIRKAGFVDPDRFIILRCPHPAYARNFWIPITYEWLFEPAQRDGKEVDVLTTVEIEYRLR